MHTPQYQYELSQINQRIKSIQKIKITVTKRLLTEGMDKYIKIWIIVIKIRLPYDKVYGKNKRESNIFGGLWDDKEVRKGLGCGCLHIFMLKYSFLATSPSQIINRTRVEASVE